MNRVAKQYVLPYLWITLASAVYAVGFNWCYEPNQIDHDGRCLLLSRQLFCSLRSGCPSGSCLAHSPSPSRSQLLTI